MSRRVLVPLLAVAGVASAQYSAYYTPSASGLPDKTENGQTGTNKCGTASSQTSQCQNVYIDAIDDFCLFGPPNGGGVADNEAVEVSYCTKAGRGTRVMPEGTITGAHFVRTPHYVQVTGEGDFTKIGIAPGDEGGELDPHGADGTGNPKGGLVFVNGVQSHEWFNFMSANDFCIRACFDGNRATSLCRHTYDELGCGFNAPGNYATNVFESCEGNDAEDIMYGYPGLGTFVQTDTSRGVQVPSPHPAPASYNCQNVPSAQLGGTATGFGRNAVQSTSSSSSSSSTPTSTSSSISSSSSSIPPSTSSTPLPSSSPSTLIAVPSSTSATSSSSSSISTSQRTTSNTGPTATVSSGRSAQDATSGAFPNTFTTLSAAAATTLVSFALALSLFA